MRIAQLGTFDVENYGDLLFVPVLRKRLEALDAEFIAVSPAGHSGVWSDCAPCEPFSECARSERSLDLDAVVVGGGNLIHTGGTPLPAYDQGGVTPLVAYADLWLGATEFALERSIPLIWNAPGVPGPFSSELLPLVSRALERVDYLNVRDRASAEFLSAAFDGEIHVVPDTAIDVATLWSRTEIEEAYTASYAERGRSVRGPSAVFHLNSRYLDESTPAIAARLDRICSRLDVTPILLAIGPCHGDGELASRVGRAMKTDPLVIDKPRSLREVAAVIANAHVYLGSSLHGVITACAFGVRAINVASRRLPKFAGFLEQFGLEEWLTESWKEADAAVDRLVRTADEPWESIRERAEPLLDAHWQIVREQVCNHSPGERATGEARDKELSGYREAVVIGGAAKTFRETTKLKASLHKHIEKARAPNERAGESYEEMRASRDALKEQLTKQTAELAEARAQREQLEQEVPELLNARSRDLERSLEVIDRDLGALVSWGRTLSECTLWMLHSRTWQVGDRLVSTLARRRAQRIPFRAPESARRLRKEIDILCDLPRSPRSLEDDADIDAARRRVGALEMSLAEKSARRDELRSALDALGEQIQLILASRRWRSGRSIVKTGKTMLLRPERNVEWAPELFRDTWAQYRSWRSGYERRPDLGTQCVTASSRRTSGATPPRSAAEFQDQDGQVAAQDITVLIPIYNAYDEVEACLESVLRWTPGEECRILLLDDASPDPRIAPLLQSFADRDHRFVVCSAESNLGYTKNINRGCKLAKGDVVLLNSDTCVTRDWLRKLEQASRSRPDVATVTPLSNAAGAFSIPVRNEINDIPAGRSADDVAELVERFSDRLLPEAPTGNGFCMYITRAAIDAVGLFDEDAFPRGYGEENDFCVRASNAGFVHLIEDATYIYHRRSASFGAEKEKLIAASRLRLREMHPGYKPAVDEWLARDDLAGLRERLSAALAAPASESRPTPGACILYIVHDGQGGTRFTSEDLISRVAKDYRCLLLRVAVDSWTLLEARGNELVTLAQMRFRKAWQLDAKIDQERVAALRKLCLEHGVTLVHMRHLLALGPEVVDELDQLRLPVVFSFHDFFAVCPTIHLVDNNGVYCGGHCTPGDGACPTAKNWLRSVPELKHSYVYDWRDRVGEALDRCAGFVTTSTVARDVISQHFPFLRERDFRVIPHGRDLSAYRFQPVRPEKGKARVVIFGALGANKGLRLIESVLRLNHERRGPFEFHFLGNVARDFRPKSFGAVSHGPYQRGELPDRLAAIAPSFSIVASIWPETYCHTMTESWASGLPVFASHFGALKERIEQFGGGWVLDPSDPEAWYDAMLAVMAEPGEYDRKIAELESMPHVTLEQMAGGYLELYRSLLSTSPSRLPSEVQVSQ